MSFTSNTMTPMNSVVIMVIITKARSTSIFKVHLESELVFLKQLPVTMSSSLVELEYCLSWTYSSSFWKRPLIDSLIKKMDRLVDYLSLRIIRGFSKVTSRSLSMERLELMLISMERRLLTICTRSARRLEIKTSLTGISKYPKERKIITCQWQRKDLPNNSLKERLVTRLRDSLSVDHQEWCKVPHLL